MLEIEVNLIDMAQKEELDVIVHGCNRQCQMGKGIALIIKTRFPEAYDSLGRNLQQFVGENAEF